MKKYFYLIALIILCLFITSCNNRQLTRVNGPVFAETGKNEKLEVVRVTPKGTVEDSSQTDAISISFNQAMVPLTTLPEEEVEGTFIIEPSLKGKYRWMGSSTLAFIPSEPLPFGTAFTVTLPAGIKALSGAVLEKDYTWSFETLRPKFVGRETPTYYDLLGLDEPVYLFFNQPMEPDSAKDFIEFYKLNQDTLNIEKKVPLKIRSMETDEKLSEDIEPEYILVVEPEEKLEPGSLYNLKLLQDLPGKTGHLGMVEEKVLDFPTENIFTFKGIESAEALSPESGVIFDFTNPVDYGELINNIKFDPPLEVP